jgi:hypothetical protein
MAKRNKARSDGESSESGAISTIESLADGPSGGVQIAKSGERVSLQVTDSGAVAWDRVRSGTRDQLRKMAQDPAFFAELGLDRPSGVASMALPTIAIDSTVCGYIFGALGALKQTIAIRAGYSPATSKLALYSQAEIEALSGPAAAVLNKHFGSHLNKYPEETALLVQLAMIEFGKVLVMREADKAERVNAQPQ